MTRRPARQPPASRAARPAPADGQPAADGGETDLDACIARLATDAPPLSGAQRDQLTLILRRSAAPETTDPARPAGPGAAPAGPSSGDQALMGHWPPGSCTAPGPSLRGQEDEGPLPGGTSRATPVIVATCAWPGRPGRRGHVRAHAAARAGRPALARTGPGRVARTSGCPYRRRSAVVAVRPAPDQSWSPNQARSDNGQLIWACAAGAARPPGPAGSRHRRAGLKSPGPGGPKMPGRAVPGCTGPAGLRAGASNGR
jgi:hypothetical protein